MAVYVDDARIQMGRMKMCHMLADTTDELLAMATKIGLSHRHLQASGEPNEHFDVSVSYRAKAVREGAIEIDSRGLVKLIRKKRSAAAGAEGAVRAVEPADAEMQADPEPEDFGLPEGRTPIDLSGLGLDDDWTGGDA